MAGKALFAVLLGAGLAASSMAAAQDAAACDGGTPLDRFACDVPALGLLNTQLRAAEAQAAAALPAELRASFAAAQGQWRRYATNLCLVTPARAVGDSTTAGEAVYCLGTAISARIKDLPRFRERHGVHAFLRQEVFAAGPVDDAPPNGQAVWSVEAAYPVLEGAGPAIVQWNRLAAQRFADTLEFDPAGTGVEPILTDELLDYSVQYATERAIGITWHYWTYGHGAAHGIPADAAMHHRLDLNRPLAAEDVFAAGTGWEAALTQACFDDLRQRHGDALLIRSAAEIADSVASPDSWLIGRDGLTVFFNVYEVAPYADGRQDVKLAWSRLFPYLRNNAPPDFAAAFPAFLRP